MLGVQRCHSCLHKQTRIMMKSISLHLVIAVLVNVRMSVGSFLTIGLVGVVNKYIFLKLKKIEPASSQTTQLIQKDLNNKNYDMLLHIGDISCIIKILLFFGVYIFRCCRICYSMGTVF